MRGQKRECVPRQRSADAEAPRSRDGGRDRKLRFRIVHPLEDEVAEGLALSLGDEVRHPVLGEVVGVRGPRVLCGRGGRTCPGRCRCLVVEDDEGELHGEVEILGPADAKGEALGLGEGGGLQSEPPVHLLLGEGQAVPGCQHLFGSRDDDSAASWRPAKRPSRGPPAPTFPSSSRRRSSRAKLVRDGLTLAGGREPHSVRKTPARPNVKPDRASGPSGKTQG